MSTEKRDADYSLRSRPSGSTAGMKGEGKRQGPSFHKEENEDDQWELGERERTEQFLVIPPPWGPEWRRTPLFLLLGLILLVIAGWFGRSFLQQPIMPPLPDVRSELPSAPVSPLVIPPPTFTFIEPQEEAVKIVEGETASFVAQASSAAPLHYQWLLEGKPVAQGQQWSYRPTAEEDTETKKVQVIVSDQDGQQIEREWRVTVAPAPLQPRVATVTPPPVTEPPVQATPPPPVTEPPVQKNSPPHITQRFPVENIVSAQRGDSIKFSAVALDPDGDALSYSWSVDGKPRAQGERFFYEAMSPGKHRVELAATDQSGLKDAWRWEVRVTAPPAAPRMIMYTPHQDQVTFASYFTRFFGVEIETPDSVEPLLHYEWRIDNRFAGESELLEWKNQPPGRHVVDVTVTGASGTSVSHRWIVNVQGQQEVGEQNAAGPPRLAVARLDNNISADKSQVVVRGRLQNIGERTVENIIAWVSALDAQQNTVSRRLVLPAPQPLAPGQEAVFQVAFLNRSKIVDFHVEVVSK